MKLRRVRSAGSVAVEPEQWAIIHFAPRSGERFSIDVRTCPLGRPAFHHWRPDGTCLCHEAKS
jgi:hypothetical protein